MVKINDAHGTYNTDRQMKFKTSVLKSHILVSGTITVLNTGTAANPDNKIIKNCGPMTDCISEINNALIDNAKGNSNASV